MRNHIIPQKYLHGFTDNDSCLWTYQKDEVKPIYAHPKTTGFVNNFYSDTIEQELNRNFEIPAKPVLDKIRDFQPITESDKHLLSTYIINMILRVPHSKVIIRSQINSVRNKVLWDTARMIMNRTGKTIIEIQHTLENLRLGLENPEQESRLFEYMLAPNRMKNGLDCINNMTWQFLTFNSASAFLTSDNPVFYFPDIGIGNDDSELIFPISTNIVLWASWQQSFASQYCPVDMAIVTEINRKIAFTATRFIYFPSEENWVKAMIKETTLPLRKIVVTGDGKHTLMPR